MAILSRQEEIMSTTNEHNSGPLGVGYTADDHNGHTGTGYTAEDAQEALEEAQREGAAHGVHEFGTNFTFGHEGE